MAGNGAFEAGGFWLLAGTIALGVALLLILGARQARRAIAADAAEAAEEDAPDPVLLRDMEIYREQLREVERELQRGTLPEAEGQQMRAEIGRRLLEADRLSRARRRRGTASAERAGSLALPALLILLASAGGLALYARLGAPGYADMPIAARLAEADARMKQRPSQADFVRDLPPPPAPEGVEPEFLELMEKLRRAVDPATATDLRGLNLLSRNEAALGNFATAEAAQRRILALLGEKATAEDHAALADILVRAAQGYVSPEAEAALIAALKLDPQNGMARYYSGLLFAQVGRYDRAFALWRPLLENGPQDAPWLPFLRAGIGEVAALAGVKYEIPPERGPSAADIAASESLSPAERQAMIEGMVAQLSQRLAESGGTAAEWARLISSLGVLGRREEAREIHAEAMAIFDVRPEDKALIDAAARDAGILPEGAGE